MKMNKILTAFASTFLMSSFASAGICEISFVREACPGQEATSYKKCDGQKACSQKKKATSAEECQKIASEDCSNSRLDITKSKVVKAKFDGKALKALKDPSGRFPASDDENFCSPTRDDFNKCEN